jgi:hypothetical protein
MPLAHLLWRLSEGKSAAATDTKPTEAHCLLCRRTLRVVATPDGCRERRHLHVGGGGVRRNSPVSPRG